jgi:DICT domain-containing protein/signal transduction histidine kinase
MEDQVLAGDDQPLVIASFQRERFYRQEANRYLRIADLTDQVYILATPETDFTNRSDHYETIAFEPEDALSHEWHLVVLGQRYASCLICKEKRAEPQSRAPELHVDQSRRFEGLWTFDRQIVFQAAELMLQRIVQYRPELAKKAQQGLARLQTTASDRFSRVDPEPFAERLVTYLQAGQYKLSKAYRTLAEKERKERLVNLITSAVRRSLNPDEILQVAAQELGHALRACRCLIYRCKANQTSVTLHHEFLDGACPDGQQPADSLVGTVWQLTANPMFEAALARQESVYISDTTEPNEFAQDPTWQAMVAKAGIQAWLIVPLLQQGQLVGMVELHICKSHPDRLAKHELELVNTVATQIVTALIQAEAYAHLEQFNQQLEALDRTRSNLIAITGHELRTPLSTIQVCLESLATDPTMSPDLRQVMLNSALADAERMRKLIQDFLTLSRLESGRIEWRLEPLPLQECVDLSLSSLRARYGSALPTIQVDLPAELPWVQVDGEWLVEALSKLLDNACKFTASPGQITIQAHLCATQPMLEVIVADTGRGIEPQLLEAVFDRFYQEEGALRRSTGGTGLGLAICRQIITGWGGKIWAESAGKDQGSQFHFTIPIVAAELPPAPPPPNKRKRRR